jgi:glycosyltransferase involved in cell wall biosynthesis
VGNLAGTAYVAGLRRNAGSDIRFLGGVYDRKALSVLRAHARCYLHGHSVGGTNPSLLEAMASRNLCVCHDNPFNREVVGENGLFFREEEQLGSCLGDIESGGMERFERMRSGVFDRIVDYYNWDKIAFRYNELFTAALSEARH